MRIVVVGCGGVGGVLAAGLTKAGHDVTPVTANPEISIALSKHGYRVRELDGTEWSVPTTRPPVHAFERRMHGSPFDLCILATKATTLTVAAESAGPHLCATSAVLCCQNGLPEGIVAPIVGRERVLGCVVSFGATMEEPGSYVVTARGGLRLGRPFTESPDPAAWLGVLGAAVPTMVVPDLAAVRWSKLALNCASSTLGLIGGVKLGSLLRRRFVRRLVLEIWTEVAAVAAATGHRMEPIGGTFDIGRMALTPRERAWPLLSPSLAVKHAFLIGVGFKYRSMRSSMLVALERGRAPEIDALNGEIVRRGAAAGVPTPVNERLVATVHCIVAGAERPSTRLLREVSEGVSATPRASTGPRSLPRPPGTPDLERTERAGARTQSLQSE